MGSVDTNTNYDYIIIGGGTAGLTVASRLSEDPEVSVLVVEAGQDRTADPVVLTPGLVVDLYGKPEYDWGFKSVPQEKLKGRKLVQPRGKMLGGSSALNFMMVLHPSRGSLDAWEKAGNDGWNFDALAPYFRKFATSHVPPQAAKDVVGLTYHEETLLGDGPIQVSYGNGYGVTNASWMKSFASLGLDMTADVRTGEAMGAFQQPASIDPITKTRSFAGNAYYNTDVRTRVNLTVMAESTVHKVLFATSDNAEPVAQGILVESLGGTKHMIHGKEVILCAGALMSPQILELSGIGSKAVLDQYGIRVVVENTSVGENLQDHPMAVQSFEVNEGVPSGDVLRDPAVVNALLTQYQNGGDGPMGQSNISVAYTPLLDGNGICSEEIKQKLFAAHENDLQNSDVSVLRDLLAGNIDEPFAEYLLFPAQGDSTMQDAEGIATYLTPTQPTNGISVFTLISHPFSKGSVHIISSDVHDLPAWDPNFLSHPIDIDIVARQVQFVEKLIRTKPFSDLLKPGGFRIPNIDGTTLEGASEIARSTMLSDFHPSCSCAMLPRNKGGVVDSRLRVYGTKGLRVVDASIFPMVPPGNIQSVVYAVAERAADIIKEDRRRG